LVKLTSTLEKEKQNSHTLQTKLDAALVTIEQQNTQVQTLQKAVQSKNAQQRTSENDENKQNENDSAESKLKSNSQSQSPIVNPTSTFSFYHIIVLAILCFVLGRVFGSSS